MRSLLRRLTAALLLLTLTTGIISPVGAELTDPDAKSPLSDAIPTTPTNTNKPETPSTPPPAPGNSRPAMIEVSVDSLEISETNSNVLGFLWGQIGAVPQNGGQPTLDTNHLNFIEGPTPGIIKVGTLVRASLMSQFQALIQSNQIRILANPTLLTKSGSEASFLVGGEIPYPTPGQLGQIGVEFKKYGVALKILPNLTPRNTIDATINVGVSSPDSSVAIQLAGVTVPGLSAREASSKVEVNDGETVVLAGIKESRRSKVVTKIPILGSIPLIGFFFRNKDEEVTQVSLVFFVTFRLVK